MNLQDHCKKKNIYNTFVFTFHWNISTTNRCYVWRKSIWIWCRSLDRFKHTLRDHDVQQGEITFQIKVYSFSLAFAVCNAFPCVSNGIAIVFGRRNFTQCEIYLFGVQLCSIFKKKTSDCGFSIWTFRFLFRLL